MNFVGYTFINLFSLIFGCKVTAISVICKAFRPYFYVFRHIFDIYQALRGLHFKKNYIFATPKKDIRMNKVLAILCLGALLLGGCKRETKDERFQREFQKFTQNECPVLMDPGTRLDSAVYDIPTHTLSYYYTVQNDLDDESIYENEDLTSSFRSNMLKGLKGSLPMKPYKDEGITFHYAYRSISSGKTLYELTFTSEDY